MKLGNDRIREKFDEIEGKIDFLIKHYNELKSENEKLLLKNKNLEAELDKRNMLEEQFSEHNFMVQSKVDSLLAKLNQFSGDAVYQETSD
jgi:regulator of replication initiation timing